MTNFREALFAPLQVGDIACRNRIFMAPMTRSRADERDCPTALHVEYYRQRSSAGLIFSEGIQPSPNGKGYARTPGLHSSQQVDAWRAVTDAVHLRGGAIVAQLMHTGRIATHYNKSPGARTVAPCAIRANVELFTDVAGMQPCDTPDALSAAGIADVVNEYATAATLAREAGFDGVELHCTSGYLPMQFMAHNTNLRTDGYGGSTTGRIRFVVEVLQALCEAIGSGRVGLRICPGNPFNDVLDFDPIDTHRTLLESIRSLRCGWVHVIASPDKSLDAFSLVRTEFDGCVILNDGFNGSSAAAAIESNQGDAVSFGRHFIANPDLVERIAADIELAPFDRKTLYSPGARGYTDYPVGQKA